MAKFITVNKISPEQLGQMQSVDLGNLSPEQLQTINQFGVGQFLQGGKTTSAVEQLTAMAPIPEPIPTVPALGIQAQAGTAPIAPQKTAVPEISSLDSYLKVTGEAGEAFGIPGLERETQSLVSSLTQMLGRPVSASEIFSEKAKQYGLEAAQTKVAAFDTQLAARKAEWEKSLLAIENQPIPMEIITGQQASQLKLANIDLARLQSEREAVAGDYKRAFELSQFASNLELQSRQEQERALRGQLELKQTQLTSAQKKQLDFVTDYLKRTQPDVQIIQSTDDRGNLTIVGINKNTGTETYRRTIAGAGKATGAKLSLSETTKLGLPTSLVGKTEEEIGKDLESIEPPAWFREIAEQRAQMTVSQEELKRLWTELVGKVKSAGTAVSYENL